MPINIHVRQLEAFLEVAKTCSFSEAAAKLYLTQPSLSVQIQRLEETLGLPLFIRNTRRVALTEAGRQFYPTAEQVVGRLTKSIKENRAMAAGLQGKVTFSALLTVGASLIPSAMARFSQRYPKVSIEYIEEKDEPIYQQVLNGDVDFGIGVPPRINSDIDFTPIYKDYLYFVCSKQHPLANLEYVSWHEIVKWPFIAMNPGSSLRALMEQGFAIANTPLIPVQEAKYQSTILGMAANDIGVSVLPSSIKFMFEHPNIMLIRIEERLHRNIGVLSRKDEPILPAAKLFVTTLLELINANRNLLPPI